MEENKNVDIQQETQNLEQAPNQEELNLTIEQLRLEQNLPFAIMAGLGAAIVMAILWAVITVVTNYQIGYMAIAVGLAVGVAVRFAGKGIDKIYAIIGAVGAVLGCVLGNFLSQVGFISQDPEVTLSYFGVLKLFLSNMDVIVEVMQETFSPIDLLFYGIAIYEGYRFSFRKFE